MKQDNKEQTETFESFYNKINVNVYPPSTSNSIKYKLERLKQLHEQERDFLIAKLSNKLDIIKEKDKKIEELKQQLEVMK